MMSLKKPRPLNAKRRKSPLLKNQNQSPKQKTKQKQTQTQNVIINLSDVRKRTRRKMSSSGGKRPLPLSSFSGSAQAPIYVNPHGSAYRDLIRPIKEHQREMRASAQEDLRRSDQQRELLRSDFKKSQEGQSTMNRALIKELRANKLEGNLGQVTPPPTAGNLAKPTKAPTVGNLEKPTVNLPTIKEEKKPRKRTPEQKAKARARALELKAERASNNAAKAARDPDVEETDVDDAAFRKTMDDEYDRMYGL